MADFIISTRRQSDMSPVPNVPWELVGPLPSLGLVESGQTNSLGISPVPASAFGGVSGDYRTTANLTGAAWVTNPIDATVSLPDEIPGASFLATVIPPLKQCFRPASSWVWKVCYHFIPSELAITFHHNKVPYGTWRYKRQYDPHYLAFLLAPSKGLHARQFYAVEAGRRVALDA